MRLEVDVSVLVTAPFSAIVLAAVTALSVFSFSSTALAEEEAAPVASALLPDWKPAAFGIELRPVLGFEYAHNPQSKRTLLQGEAGGYLGVNGVPLVPGNPGAVVEPSLGYAVGTITIDESGKTQQSGTYQRTWGGVRLPIYYRFIRQLFEQRLGVVSGGPQPTSRRNLFRSDTGVAIVQHVSAHYTLTYEKAHGSGTEYPEISSYDHWIHGRLSTSTLNFFVDAGPGYSQSKSSLSLGTLGNREGTTSGVYLLGVSGFDLVTDKIGFDAAAKYMFSSQTDVSFTPSTARSPLEDLGAQAALTTLPADSLHVSAFFGIRNLFGPFGVGYRYSLQVLNYSEADNKKQQRTETSGLGIHASVRF
jgi:hypothetical protein